MSVLAFHIYHWCEIALLFAILSRVVNINREEHKIMVNQKTFDTDLAALVTAIGALITAVNAQMAATPAADLTAEDTSVLSATTSVANALAALAPAGTTTPAPPAPAPTA